MNNLAFTIILLSFLMSLSSCQTLSNKRNRELVDQAQMEKMKHRVRVGYPIMGAFSDLDDKVISGAKISHYQLDDSRLVMSAEFRNVTISATVDVAILSPSEIFSFIVYYPAIVAGPVTLEDCPSRSPKFVEKVHQLKITHRFFHEEGVRFKPQILPPPE